MRRTLLILLALGAATVAAYWGVFACGFVAYDDPSYVCRNPMVNQGVREAAIYWAFTAVHGGNWHPLSESWDGTSWTVVPTPDPAIAGTNPFGHSAELGDVSCPARA